MGGYVKTCLVQLTSTRQGSCELPLGNPSSRLSDSLEFSHFNLLLWNCWAKWNQTWQEASSGKVLYKVCSFRLDRMIKHGFRGQFLILIGWIFKNLLLWNLLGQMEPNLTGSIYGRCCIKFVHFVPIGRQTWLPWAILNSDWLNFQKSSPLKRLGQMEPNLTGSIYGRSCMKFVHFVPIGQQTCPPMGNS